MWLPVGQCGRASLLVPMRWLQPAERRHCHVNASRPRCSMAVLQQHVYSGCDGHSVGPHANRVGQFCPAPLQPAQRLHRQKYMHKVMPTACRSLPDCANTPAFGCFFAAQHSRS
jgi:hypothetical protein